MEIHFRGSSHEKFMSYHRKYLLVRIVIRQTTFIMRIF